MKPLYDHIGRSYDLTRKADPEIVRRLRYLLHVQDFASVLDVACGTGNYTAALANTRLRMTGVDLSQVMIEQARQKSADVEWIQADVSNLPVSNSQFEGVACILAIHHINEWIRPFREVYRVLSQGRFVIFTSSPEQIDSYWLKEYFPNAIASASQQMPDVSLILESLKKAGFSIVGVETFLVQPDLQDFFLYSGKYNPSIYLNEKVRSGISTFASLTSPEEIELGCGKLQKDIESGRIYQVLDEYRSESGDYLFIVVKDC